MADSSSIFSGFGFGKIGSVGGSFAGAVGDIFAAQGDLAEAQNYEMAAQLAYGNVGYTERMTKIRELQTQREVNQVIGAQQAGYAGGNIAESGSALDVLRSSVQQGALQEAVINQQGVQQEAAYSEQAQSYENMAAAAKKSAEGSDIAAGIRAVTGVAALFGI